MSQNLSSAAVEIGAIMVNPLSDNGDWDRQKEIQPFSFKYGINLDLTFSVNRLLSDY